MLDEKKGFLSSLRGQEQDYLSKVFDAQKDVNWSKNSIHLQDQYSEAMERLEEHTEELKEELYNIQEQHIQVTDMASAIRHIVREVLTSYMVASDRAVNDELKEAEYSKEFGGMIKQYIDLSEKAKELEETGETNFDSFTSSITNILRSNGEEEESDNLTKILEKMGIEEQGMLLNEAKGFFSTSLDEIVERINKEVVDLEQVDAEEKQLLEQENKQVVRQ